MKNGETIIKKLIIIISVLTCFIMVFLCACASKDGASSSDRDALTLDEPQTSEAETDAESDVMHDETDAESESPESENADAESSDETSSADTKKELANNTNTPSEDQSRTEEIVISGNVSGNSGSNSSGGGGQSSNQQNGSSNGSDDQSGQNTGGIQTGAGENMHCSADAPSLEYEDTSNTLPFMPIKQEGATNPNADYNKPKKNRSDIIPGLVYQGSAEYSTTIVGYDGFIFSQETLRDYDGTALMTPDRLDSVVNMVVERNRWVESTEGGKKKMKMYIVFIPNKNSIYPEYMPKGYTMGTYRPIDQMVEALRAKGISVIDGRESLLAAKNANPARCLYYKTDTHWNNHGGFEVYRQLMTEIQKDFPNVVIHSR
ncbi:MAG: hypothetical protein IKN38_10890, partial [Clostridia bacterium]|nr:hypothetical protein [Clostridia bacterium]